MANKWIKFLQNYTKKQKQKNPKYTYMKAMKDPNAKKMYKKYGGSEGEMDDSDSDSDNEKVENIEMSMNEPSANNETENTTIMGGKKKTEKKTRKRRKNKSCKSCKSVSFF
jgi:hypothetical protein